MAKILIIEDDPYVRRFYSRLFNLTKYQIEMLTDTEDIIERIKNFRPDLILLDIMMPKTSGIQVLQKLKADSLTKDFPVVMLSNLGDDETVKEGFKLGAIGFIIKSNTPPNQLLDEVDKYLHANENISS